jgi:uncharacterized protein YqjF (DUF2071 family)
MKRLKILNTIALLIPIILGLLGFFDAHYFTFALFSTILTGLIQVSIATYFAITFPKNKYIIVYFILIFVFFVGWLGFGSKDWIWFLPIVLSIYLSILIYATPSEKTSFMKAEWNDLLFINYEINPEFLKKYVPKGTELDLWNGKCYISLIGFMFEDVKVLGVKIPYHMNFEEVNLRFYVRRYEDGIWKRGVVFVKEIVPKYAITFVANTLYNEQYQTLPMRHERTSDLDSLLFKYEWKKNNFWNSISVKTGKELIPIEVNSEAEFISEHYYGYTISPRKKTVEYEVRHPRWHQYQVLDYAVNVDFEMVYGKEFAFLQDLIADSCFVAKGSKISIESKRVF